VSLAEQSGSDIHRFADIAKASRDDTEQEGLDRISSRVFAWSFSTQPVHGGRKNSINSIGSLAADLDLKFVNDGIDHEDTHYLRWRR
jgi:hypothetical protein